MSAYSDMMAAIGDWGQRTAASQLAGAHAIGQGLSDLGNYYGPEGQAKRMQTQALGLQLTDMQRHEATVMAMEQALTDPANRTPEGQLDPQKVGEHLMRMNPSAGLQWNDMQQKTRVASVAYTKAIADLEATSLSNQEKQQKIAELKREQFGATAYATLQQLEQKPGDPRHARDSFLAGVATAASQGLIPGDTAKQLAMQAATAAPDDIKGFIAQAIPPEIKAKLDSQAATTAKNVAESRKTLAEAGNLEQFGRATAPEAQKAEFRLDGKDVVGSFVPTPTGGRYIYRGEDVTSRAQKVPSQSAVTLNQGVTDAKSIADAIIAGDQPPDVKGLFRLAGPVRAELARQGYNMTEANLDWEATKKHLATMNGAQQTRLRQAISTASDSLGVIEDLAKQWDGGKFPMLNKASLALAVNGAMGPKAQQIATNLQAQITDVTSELGNVYMGGNSPTDHALGLAQKNLSADWTKAQLLSAIQLARTNLQIRANSITNAGPVLSGGATTPPPSAPPPAVSAPKKGETKPIDGYPGTEQTFNGTAWIRTK